MEGGPLQDKQCGKLPFLFLAWLFVHKRECVDVIHFDRGKIDVWFATIDGVSTAF